MMELTKISAGFFALVLTFVGLSLLLGPFIPALQETEWTVLQHLGLALAGVFAIGCALLTWLWATKTPASK